MALTRWAGLASIARTLSSHLVDHALDLAAVDVQFAGDGALAAARFVPGAGVCSSVGAIDSSGCASCASGGAGWYGVTGPVSPARELLLARISIISSSNEPTSAKAGQALTRPPTGPWPTPCARLAPTVATIPAPRLQAASRGTGWPRRLESSITMDAAQISPFTVNGSNRAVRPNSPCERTSSNACWYEMTAATTATATTASAVVILMSRSVAAPAPHGSR